MSDPISAPQGANELTFDDLARRARRTAAALRAGRGTIVRTMVPFLLIGLAVAFGSSTEYRAEMRILPYRAAGGAAGLAGLGAIAGVKLPAGVVDQLITGDLYPDIVASIDYRVTLARSPIRFGTLDTTASLERYFLAIRRPAPLELVRRYTIGLPALLLARARDGGTPPSRAAAPIPAYGRDFVSVLEEVRERVVLETDRRSGVVVIGATMPDPYAAADLVRTATDLLTRRVVALEVQKAREQLRFLTGQHATLLARYDRAQRDFAVFEDRNRVLLSATANLAGDRIRRERDLAYQLYQQVSVDLEQARIKVSQDTPVFAVLEHPVVPGSRHSPRRASILLLFGAMGLLVGAGRALLGSTTR